jgi:hypothetical protein
MAGAGIVPVAADLILSLIVTVAEQLLPRPALTFDLRRIL